jgi:hypothetical protein
MNFVYEANGVTVHIELSEQKVAAIAKEWIDKFLTEEKLAEIVKEWFDSQPFTSKIVGEKKVVPCEEVHKKLTEKEVVAQKFPEPAEKRTQGTTKTECKRRWTKEDVASLMSLLNKGFTNKQIAILLRRSETAVRVRASLELRHAKQQPTAENPLVNSRRFATWDNEHDKYLADFVDANGFSKKSFSRVADELRRTPFACRKRYYALRRDGKVANAIRKKVKWTQNEEDILLKEIGMRGTSDDALIATAKLLGRSVFSIKMRYSQILSKKKYEESQGTDNGQKTFRLE